MFIALAEREMIRKECFVQEQVREWDGEREGVRERVKLITDFE